MFSLQTDIWLTKKGSVYHDIYDVIMICINRFLIILFLFFSGKSDNNI
jgi:hypothetical protein